MSKKVYKLLIVDDHPVVRDGIKMMLDGESDLEVSLVADSVSSAVNLLKVSAVDLVLVDLNLKDESGLDLIAIMSEQFTDTKAMVLSIVDDPRVIQRARRIGARGYVTKESPGEELIMAIKAILAGDEYFISLKDQPAAGQADSQLHPHLPLEQLSDRENEIFNLIGQGYHTREISRILDLSAHTIETHKRNIRSKLDLHSSADLTRAAIRHVNH